MLLSYIGMWLFTQNVEQEIMNGERDQRERRYISDESKEWNEPRIIQDIFESATFSFRIQTFLHPHVAYSNRIRLSAHIRGTKPTRCAAILVYCSVRDWTRFYYIIGLSLHELSDKLRIYLFSTLESGFKNIWIRVDKA